MTRPTIAIVQGEHETTLAKRTSRAAFHRAVAVDTRICVAIAELTVGMRTDRALLERLGIAADLEHSVAALQRNLDTIRAELRRMIDDPYPQQP